LIEEHLTYNPEQTHYQGTGPDGFLLRDWYFPRGWEGPGNEVKTPVLSLQPFKGGGFEVSLRPLNLEKISRAVEFGGPRGKREKPEQLNPEHVASAAQRAKKKMRLLVKNMAATHLLTLTKRETVETGYWTEDDWKRYWDRLRRQLVRALGGEFPYVAIPERHEKGNYHLHIAWCGRINLKLVRRLWWAICGGRGQGNVDAQHIRVKQGGDRSHRIARYISKYIGKHFEASPWFNKKRYWASRQTLEEVRRFVMRATDMPSAIKEMFEFLGIDPARFVDANGKTPHLFHFPGGDGLWLAFIPEIHATPPPF
jgi:hypothetical protein